MVIGLDLADGIVYRSNAGTDGEMFCTFLLTRCNLTTDHYHQSVALNFTPPCQNDQFWSDPASNPYTPTLIPQNEWSRKIDPAIWSRKMSDPANLIPLTCFDLQILAVSTHFD